MPTQDEEIARHLDDALKSGELQRAKGFGRPMPEDAGWDATPQEFRMAFRILKNSEFVPREIEMLRRRAELGAKIRSCGDAAATANADADAEPAGAGHRASARVTARQRHSVSMPALSSAIGARGCLTMRHATTRKSGPIRCPHHRLAPST
jgi:hypothetical protein